MRGGMAAVALCMIIAAVCHARTVDPFIAQGLRPAACIVLDHRIESYHSARNILKRGGARALHAFPPDVIFGRFPDDLTEASFAPLHVAIVRSVDGIESADLNPISRRVLSNLFGGRAFFEGARRLPAGPIRDVVITEPPAIGGRAKHRGPRRGSPMEVTGRGFRQNSEFMIGSVLINVVFPESAGGSEEWTDDEIAEALSGIALGVGEYQLLANWTDLDFTYNYEDYIRVPISMEPIEVGEWKSTDSLWISEAMDYLGHGDEDTYWLKVHSLNNETRARFETDWVLTAFIVDDSAHYPGCWEKAFYTAYAGFGGPFLVVPHPACEWGYGAPFAGVFIHEMSHNFYALDEYDGGQPCSEYSGYLNVQNRNALTDSCQETVPCIMRADFSSTPFPVCEYTIGQIGLADENMNAIPDIYEVNPSIEFIDIPGATADTIVEDSYLMAVRMINEARPNENPYQLEKFPDRMIDYAPWLVSGWYAINDGAIMEITPSDGSWGESREDIGFFMEELDPGMNTITVHVENCVGLTAEAQTQVVYVGIRYYEVTANVADQHIDIAWVTAAEVFGARFDIERDDLTSDVGLEIIASVSEPVVSNERRKQYAYRDETLAAGHNYRYRIVARFRLGVDQVVRDFVFSSQDIYRTAMLPIVSGIVSNLLPNPTSDRMTFTVDIPKSFRSLSGRSPRTGLSEESVRELGRGVSAQGLIEEKTFVDISIYDVTGRRIATIYSRERFGGLETFTWDGVDSEGRLVPSGVYFLRVSAGSEIAVRKAVILR